MLIFGKALDAAVWATLVCCNWVVFQCQGAVEWWMDAVLGTWEESLKSVIRESFAHATRIVNGIFAWLLAIFAESHQTWHNPFQRSQAWQAWWRENRQSTFNAIIARDRTIGRMPSSFTSSYGSLRGTLSGRGEAQGTQPALARACTISAITTQARRCFRPGRNERRTFLYAAPDHDTLLACLREFCCRLLLCLCRSQYFSMCVSVRTGTSVFLRASSGMLYITSGISRTALADTTL